MQDEETGTWWQQVSGEAILGPLKGKRLEAIPWDEVSFGRWKTEHPHSLVLDVLEKYKSEYAAADWDIKILKRPTVTPESPRDPLKPRDVVIGIAVDGLKKAYPLEDLKKQNPVIDQLGATPLLLVVDSDGKSVRCFKRTIDGVTLGLYLKPGSEPMVLVDTQSASEWNFAGEALSGPMTGKVLDRIQSLKDFWFDWKIYNPATLMFSAGKMPSGK